MQEEERLISGREFVRRQVAHDAEEPLVDVDAATGISEAAVDAADLPTSSSSSPARAPKRPRESGGVRTLGIRVQILLRRAKARTRAALSGENRGRVTIVLGACLVAALMTIGAATLFSSGEEPAPVSAPSNTEEAPIDATSEPPRRVVEHRKVRPVKVLPWVVVTERVQSIEVRLTAPEAGPVRWELRGPEGRLIDERELVIGPKARTFLVDGLAAGARYTWRVVPTVAGHAREGGVTVEAPAPPTTTDTSYDDSDDYTTTTSPPPSNDGGTTTNDGGGKNTHNSGGNQNPPDPVDPDDVPTPIDPDDQ